MSSPVGHTCTALVLGRLGGNVGYDWRWWLFAVVSANAPDLDFVPGLFVGDINRWHHGVTHSILAVFVWGGLTWLVLRSRTPLATRLSIAAALIYASHLLLDFFTQDSRAPHGIPLLWPMDAYFTSPVSLFGGIMHGVPGDDFATVFWNVFSWHNAMAATREIVFVLPLFVITFLALKYFNPARQEQSNGD